MQDKQKKVFEFDGIVKDCLPDGKYSIEIDVEGNKVLVVGYPSGKMRMHYIKILDGDKVKIEITPYDLKQGRIVYRYS